MRTIVLTAALLCSTTAFAQTADTTTTTTTTTDTAAAAPAPVTEAGPVTKVLAKGDHYAVHRVMADGTVMVKVLTGEDAKLAMAGQQPAALAAFLSAQPVTAGAGTSTPQ